MALWISCPSCSTVYNAHSPTELWDAEISHLFGVIWLLLNNADIHAVTEKLDSIIQSSIKVFHVFILINMCKELHYANI